MTNNPLADSISAHVSHILDLRSQLTAAENKISSLELALRDARAQRSEIDAELTNAKKVLDFCIDKGVDPVQAKLSYNTKEISQSVDSRLESLNYKQKLFESMRHRSTGLHGEDIFIENDLLETLNKLGNSK